MKKYYRIKQKNKGYIFENSLQLKNQQQRINNCNHKIRTDNFKGVGICEESECC